MKKRIVHLHIYSIHNRIISQHLNFDWYLSRHGSVVAAVDAICLETNCLRIIEY